MERDKLYEKLLNADRKEIDHLFFRVFSYLKSSEENDSYITATEVLDFIENETQD